MSRERDIRDSGRSGFVTMGRDRGQGGQEGGAAPDYPAALVLMEATALTLSDADPVVTWPSSDGFSPTVTGAMTYIANHTGLGPAVSVPSGTAYLNCDGLTDSSTGLTVAIAAGLDLVDTGLGYFFDSERGRTAAGIRRSARPFMLDTTFRNFGVSEVVMATPAFVTLVIDDVAKTMTAYEGRTLIGSVTIGAYNGLGARVKLFSNFRGSSAIAKQVATIGLWAGASTSTRDAIWDAGEARFPGLF